VVDDIHGSTREDKQGHSEKVSKVWLYSELECYGIDCWMTAGGPLRGIVMVHMKTKVMRFPQPRHGATEVPSDDSMILFSLGGRRFAIQWTVTELAAKPAEVISMQKQRRRKGGPRWT
jgi:hypothetical protein